MYNLHYDSLLCFIELIANNYDDEITYHKVLFDKLIKETLNEDPIVPDAVLLNGLKYKKYNKDGVVVSTHVVDFDDMNEHATKEFVNTIFQDLSTSKGEDVLIKKILKNM
jgi:hypothetical protein